MCSRGQVWGCQAVTSAHTPLAEASHTAEACTNGLAGSCALPLGAGRLAHLWKDRAPLPQWPLPTLSIQSPSSSSHTHQSAQSCVQRPPTVRVCVDRFFMTSNCVKTLNVKFAIFTFRASTRPSCCAPSPPPQSRAPPPQPTLSPQTLSPPSPSPAPTPVPGAPALALGHLTCSWGLSRVEVVSLWVLIVPVTVSVRPSRSPEWPHLAACVMEPALECWGLQAPPQDLGGGSGPGAHCSPQAKGGSAAGLCEAVFVPTGSQPLTG